MAITINFIEGFEHGLPVQGGGQLPGLWDASDTGDNYAYSSVKKTGNYSGHLDGRLTKIIPATSSKLVKFSFWNNGSTGQYPCRFKNGTTELLGIYINSSGYIEIWYYGTTKIGNTGTQHINPNEWTDIEIYYYMADSGGRFDVRVKGILDITFTGDTKLTSDTTFDRILIGGAGLYDDIIIADGADGDVIGDLRVVPLAVTGAGYSTQWTPDSGSNYARINEVPPVDTSYVTVNANDQIDSYAIGSIPGGFASPQAIQISARLQKEGAPTPQNIQIGVRDSGANYMSSSIAVPSSISNLYALRTDHLTATEAVIQSKA